jgi:nucleotide-binding universal stress UspA family protein
MATAKHILVAHDFSDTAEGALHYAVDLAEKLGAALTIVHAYEVPIYGFPEGPALVPEMAAQLEQASRTALEAVVKRAARQGLKLDARLRQGPAWSEINATAKEVGADLIVLGTHGRKGVARALLGSVAEKVVRTAPLPVLTVHVHAPESKHPA